MMTGALGAVMWVMMALMITGMAAGAITWARRRPRGRDAQRPQPDSTGDGATGRDDRDTAE